MNIDQANRIPLAEILDKLDYKPTQQQNNESRYLSPINKDKKDSFIVNIEKNTWYDEQEKTHGNTISFVCFHLQRSGVSHNLPDAFRWLENMMGYAPRIEPINGLIREPRQYKLKKVSVKPLSNGELIRTVESLGIPFALASRYLKQVRVHNCETGNKLDLIGFRNEDGGYALRSRTDETSVGKQNITFIRGNVVKPDGIHIFKNKIDYLSALLRHNNGKNFDDDAIVLNSLSFLPKPTPFIKGYGYSTVFSWMDNSSLGRTAMKNLDDFFKTEEHLKHKSMNRLYAKHTSVNDWHLYKLGLPK